MSNVKADVMHIAMSNAMTDVKVAVMSDAKPFCHFQTLYDLIWSSLPIELWCWQKERPSIVATRFLMQ